MAVATSYGVGLYQASEAHCALAPRPYVRNQTKRGVLYFWGSGNVAAIALNTGYWANLARIVAEEFPVVTADYGSTTHWGNDTSITRTGTLRTFFNSNFGPKTDKVFLLAVSMGALAALNWARQNPTLVAGIALVTSAVNLPYYHDTYGGGSRTAVINTAYGGSGPYTSALPTHDPLAYAAADLAGLPVKCWTSSDDPDIRVQDVDALVAAIGGTASRVSVGAQGHGIAAGTPAEVVAFLRANA